MWPFDVSERGLVELAARCSLAPDWHAWPVRTTTARLRVALVLDRVDVVQALGFTMAGAFVRARLTPAEALRVGELVRKSCAR